MKAASPSPLAQLGTTQQPTTVGSAASSGQQPSPHTSNPGQAYSRATAGSPSADAMHRHSHNCTSGSNTAGVAAALGGHQGIQQGHQVPAQAHHGTSCMLPNTQEQQPRPAGGMPNCTRAVGTMYGVREQLQGAGGGMHEAGGAMRDAEGAMHDDLWTQEGSIVDYPSAYRQQVLMLCDWILCWAET